ncbi:MAG: ATP-binding protein [Bacillota bacterium]
MLEFLARSNPWWVGLPPNKELADKIERSELQDIQTHFSERRILAISGPRRVGKSTLIFQAIQKLIASGIEPRRILLFSGDDPLIFNAKNDLATVIELFLREIVGEDVRMLSAKIYVFIDEVHQLTGWQTYIKSYYDKQFDIKFVVSGSSAAHLFEGAKESLLGRIDYLHIFPLNFRQFARFHSRYKQSEALPEVVAPCCFDSPAAFYQTIAPDYLKLSLFENQTTNLLQEYLLAGGYPEYFEHKNIDLWQNRLAVDILASGLYRDIVSFFDVKSPLVLERIIAYVAANNGQAFSWASIGQTVGVETITAMNYAGYLERACLLCSLENYSPNTGKVIRKNRKIFVIDNGLRNAIVRETEFDSVREGMLAETVVARMAVDYAEKKFFKTYYWREKTYEVDAVICKRNRLVPVETKYRNEVTTKDLRGLNAFATEFAAPEALMVSKREFRLAGAVSVVPLWLLALCEL